MLSMSAGGVQSVLLMSGKSRWQLLNKLSSLVVAVTLNFTLVPVWGLYGAVTAWASALLIDTFLASYQVFRLVGIRASVREMAPSLFLGAAVPNGVCSGVFGFLGSELCWVSSCTWCCWCRCTVRCCSASAKHSVLSVPSARRAKS